MAWDLNRLKVRHAIKNNTEKTTIHEIALKTGVPDYEVRNLIKGELKFNLIGYWEIEHITDLDDSEQYKTADKWLEE